MENDAIWNGGELLEGRNKQANVWQNDVQITDSPHLINSVHLSFDDKPGMVIAKKKKHINDKYYFKNKNLNTACKIKKKERDIKATRNRWGICIKTIPCV